MDKTPAHGLVVAVARKAALSPRFPAVTLLEVPTLTDLTAKVEIDVDVRLT